MNLAPASIQQQVQQPEERRQVVRRTHRRVNVKKLVAVVVVLYLGGLLVYGEMLDVRLQQQKAALQRGIGTVSTQISQLQSEKQQLSKPSGAAKAARAQLGVVPKGQVPVVLVPQTHATP